jgi:hypothetical protein
MSDFILDKAYPAVLNYSMHANYIHASDQKLAILFANEVCV